MSRDECRTTRVATAPAATAPMSAAKNGVSRATGPAISCPERIQKPVGHQHIGTRPSSQPAAQSFRLDASGLGKRQGPDRRHEVHLVPADSKYSQDRAVARLVEQHERRSGVRREEPGTAEFLYTLTRELRVKTLAVRGLRLGSADELRGPAQTCSVDRHRCVASPPLDPPAWVLPLIWRALAAVDLVFAPARWKPTCAPPVMARWRPRADTAAENVRLDRGAGRTQPRGHERRSTPCPGQGRTPVYWDGCSPPLRRAALSRRNHHRRHETRASRWVWSALAPLDVRVPCRTQTRRARGPRR